MSLREKYHGEEAFENEIKAYSVVVPILRKISPLPYPTCLFSGCDNNGNALLILEDLRNSGYFSVDRLKVLNLEQSELVIRKFAQLHATSMVLRIVHRTEFDRAKGALNDYMFTATAADGQNNSIRSSFESMVRLCLKSGRRNNADGLLSHSLEFIERHFSNFQLYEIARRLVTREVDENLKAICHGDAWMNNFMFRQQTESGGCEDVKLLDLQVMRHAPPTTDLLHFLYSSTDPKLRREHYSGLLGSYQRTFIECIDSLAGPHCREKSEVAEKIRKLKAQHSLDLVLERMRRDSLYGLAQFILLLPVFTYESSRILNPSEDDDEPAEYQRRLRETLLEFDAMGVLREEFLP